MLCPKGGMQVGDFVSSFCLIFVKQIRAEEVLLIMMTQLFASDPKVLDGAPVFAGTMVLVQMLFEYLSGGESIAAFLRDFPMVSLEQVTGALDERDLH